MLEARGLVSGYAGVPVLHGVDLSVAAGEMLLILGPNGAGKTTLLRTLAGFVKASEGSVRYDGADVTGVRPERLSRAGLRLVLDGHRTFPELSVRDNLRLGGLGIRSRATLDERIEEVFEIFPGLDRRRAAVAHQLSGGERQMLVLGQALISRPRVLLCDEPSLGLAQALLPSIWAFLAARAEEGTSVVVVEQLVDESSKVAHRTVLLDQGTVAAEGPTAEILASATLSDVYFGDSTHDRSGPTHPAKGW